VYTPQIIENYQLKSGEGLSVFFVVTWLLGDLCNLAGAVMAKLQATMIILACYYSLCDIILLFQIYYYRRKSPRRVTTVPEVSIANEDGEETPLIAHGRKDPETTSHPSFFRQTLQYLSLLAFVTAVGVIAWWLNPRHEDESVPDGFRDVIEWKSQVIGWISAVLYLGARIPQILKNFQTKCEGLSLALFMFAIAGNVTYVLSICTNSMEPRHLFANSSWLAGSGLTVILDIFVLGQFFYYRSTEQESVQSEGATGSV